MPAVPPVAASSPSRWWTNPSIVVPSVIAVVETTQTISGYDGKPVNLTAAGPNVPRVVEESQGSHLLVLVNSRYLLQRVACVDLPNPPLP